MTPSIGIAVAGCGEWGRNHVRVMATIPGARLLHVADPNPARREAAQALAPGATVSESIEPALTDPRVEAVVVASPSPTHAPIGRAAIAAGKDLLVEKPLAPTVAEATDLARRAKRAGRVLVVGHILLHHPAVHHLHGVVSRRLLGRVHYLHAQRTNLGRIRTDEGALTSLGPHDVSVMAYLLGAWPVSVSAQGAAYVQPEREDVVFLTLRFPGGRLGHVHLSWLDPHKVRRLTIVGSKRMAVFDDMEPEKVRLHRYAPRDPYRGETSAPAIPPKEPLVEQAKAFLSAVRTRRAPPLCDGAAGVRVARVLAAAEKSLSLSGREVAV